MATPNVTHQFAADTLAVGEEVNQNFADVLSFLASQTVHKDASVPFTGIPSGPNADPVSANQFARKAYVDSRPTGKLIGTKEAMIDLGSLEGTVELDWGAASVWKIAPTGNVAFTFKGLPSSGEAQSGTVVVANDSHSLTWPAGTRFNNGVEPGLSGETWLSLVAIGQQVNVSAAWQDVRQL